jgi:hypothetical protein
MKVEGKVYRDTRMIFGPFLRTASFLALDSPHLQLLCCEETHSHSHSHCLPNILLSPHSLFSSLRYSNPPFLPYLLLQTAH